MELIPNIEGSTYFLNRSGNLYDYPNVLNSIYRSLDRDLFTRSDPEFVYYLDRISEDMLISVRSAMGRNTLEELAKTIEGEGENTSEFSDENWRLYTLYILCGLYARMHDYEEGKSLLEEYSEEFEDCPLFGMAKTVIYEGSGGHDDLDRALETAWNYRSENPRFYQLQMLLAKVIATSLEQDHIYQGGHEEIPSERDELATIADEAASRAMFSGNNPPEYLIVKGRVEGILGNFEAAKDQITQAITDLSRNRTRHTELISEFGRELTRIRVEQQQTDLSNQTEEIGSQVSEISENLNSTEDKINQMKEDLDDTVVNFRRNVLEFLGFFSAIIAAIVITGQIALSVADTDEIARLFIVCYGGLLFSFGGFSFMLASDARSRRDRILVMGFGFVVVGLAVFGGSIWDFLLGIPSYLL